MVCNAQHILALCVYNLLRENIVNKKIKARRGPENVTPAMYLSLDWEMKREIRSTVFEAQFLVYDFLS